MKLDLAEDVAELDVLLSEVEKLDEGSGTPLPTTRSFRIKDEAKSLAHWHKPPPLGFNQKGKPIMIIYENPRYIYGDKDTWDNVNSGDTVIITRDPLIAADGSNPGPWYTIANKRGKNGEILYIDSRDGVIV
jgi:hypothetical protein